MTNAAEAPQTKKKQRSAKVKALLAGGLIAGLGITATLASWNTGALGEWVIAGSDSPVTVELQDQDGNWAATGENGEAILLNSSSLSPIADWDGVNEKTRGTGWIENRIRVTGVGPNEQFTLTPTRTIEYDNPLYRDAWIVSFIDLTDGTGSCSDIPASSNYTMSLLGSSLSEATVRQLETYNQPSPVSLTGNFDKRICTQVYTKSNLSGHPLRADDTLRFLVDFEAAKES